MQTFESKLLYHFASLANRNLNPKPLSYTTNAYAPPRLLRHPYTQTQPLPKPSRAHAPAVRMHRPSHPSPMHIRQHHLCRGTSMPWTEGNPPRSCTAPPELTTVSPTPRRTSSPNDPLPPRPALGPNPKVSVQYGRMSALNPSN